MSDDFDFDAFLNDIKNEVDAGSGRSMQATSAAAEQQASPRPGEGTSHAAPARSRQSRPADPRRGTPSTVRSSRQPEASKVRVQRPQASPTRRTAQGPKTRKNVGIGTIIAWLFAITCLGGAIATLPSFSSVLLILAVLFIAPISPLRRRMERSHIRPWVVWTLSFVLFIGGALSSPSEKTEALDQGTTAVSRSMPEATVEPTITAEPTATPLPTDTPEPTAVPTPTPERVRGWLADTEVYVSNSNGIVHSRSNCSGMKYYWTTTIKAANDAGYPFCEKCW